MLPTTLETSHCLKICGICSMNIQRDANAKLNDIIIKSMSMNEIVLLILRRRWAEVFVSVFLPQEPLNSYLKLLPHSNRYLYLSARTT